VIGKGLEKMSGEIKNAQSKKPQVLNIIIAAVLFVAAVLFHIIITQPIIATNLASDSSAVISNRLANYSQAITQSNNTIDSFALYLTEYSRQDCGIDVKFDPTKLLSSLTETVTKLNPTPNDLKKNYYGVVTLNDLNQNKVQTLREMLVPGQKIVNVLNNYSEVDTAVNYLTKLRTLCSSITSVDNSKQAVFSTFCSKFAELQASIKPTKTEWINSMIAKSSSFNDGCVQNKDYTSLLTNFVKFNDSVLNTAPDSVQLKSDLEDIYANVQKIAETGKQTNSELVAKRSKLSGVWYLLTWF
jgi:hypothetical protein